MTTNESFANKLRSDLNEYGHIVLADVPDSHDVVTRIANTGEHAMVSVFGNSYMSTMHYCHSWLAQDRVLLNRWPDRKLGNKALIVVIDAFHNEETLGRFLQAVQRHHKVIVVGNTGPHLHKEEWNNRRAFFFGENK